MADKRKGRRGDKSSESEQQLSKEDDAIARYVRFNCPTKSTMFEGHEVQYFAGSKAIDTLLESKYGSKSTSEPMFPTRQSAFHLLKTFMENGLFFRARKLVQKKKVAPSEKERGDDKKSPKFTKPSTEADSSKEEKQVEKQDDDKKEKKQKKVKLVEHTEQYFADTNDVYIWVFDPTPFYKKVIGFLILIGTIVGCLFPLWPHWLRLAVYYVSIAGLGAFGVLIGVAVARTILFAIIWIASLGKHKLWILPNLTEDCGFFESFQPFYSYEYCPGKSTAKSKKTETENVIDTKTSSESDDEQGKNGSTQDDQEDEAELEESSKDNAEPTEEVNVSNDEDDQEEETIRQRRKVQEEDFVMVDN